MSTESIYKVTNPATGVVEKTYPIATEQDIEQAVQQAHSAYKDWKTTSIEQRSQLLHRIADKYEEKIDELAAIVTREMGKPIAQSKGELSFVAEIFRYYADTAPSLLEPDTIDVDSGKARVEKHPIGALFGIMPWNYPHYQVARFAAPNFMAGNTLVLKHAPQCPETAEAIEKLFLEAGLPQGVYNNIFATNDQAADIIRDSRIQGVSLTGSEKAGQVVAQIASSALKKVVLELGGSDPFIVLEDADLDSAVEHAIDGRFDNAGQACNAAKRLIILDSIYDRFVDKFTNAVKQISLGDPMQKNTRMGPLSSISAAENLQKQLSSAVDAGATVLVEGGYDAEKPGAWFKPAVLTDVTSDMEIYQQELFGPVAVIYKVASVEDAIALANDVPFGLGASIHTSSEDLAERLSNELEVGMVTINASSGSEANTPFGGVKRSGFGRELGRLGITEFLNFKLVRDKS
ncbi:NAD-dependent succinate-semialdehyde dehydrogenase [Psychrobacter sp. FDAARGOS_221]|uniref:NAD-dependent succinate-semialdehyde dehydrogenase n=1 Tax=Psychrobacter sp. FDAARGOS_221 TaxID=1975705 RepID=UPI000BB58116|nr:NAD-dependent succinate-semialdehyde dehydrogenase [Psychrobacter sp. FDAARGOS_221]PNK60185.1 NAD-dependent succinate-semialdehyde dehydrogenase [Psychrobacter sp. FDAARGOS_221]